MRCVARSHCSLLQGFRLAILASAAITVAGCSADFERFEQTLPRFGSREATNSVPQPPAPVSQVQSTPLPPPGGSPRVTSYAPTRSDDDLTGSVASRKSAAASGNIVHVIAPGETLMKLTRQYGKSLSEIAKANNIPPHTMVKVGDRIIIPGTHAPKTAAQAQPKRQAPAPRLAAPAAPAEAPAQAQPRPAAPAPKFAAASQGAPADTARMVTPAAHNPDPEPLKREATAGVPSFRWPVRGRVINAFGPRPSGQQNDGINVAVPEGTLIKAAEDGIVAYAGNELKTYGNLVLVRHSNGYVTAYAHASEILVKRDDPVKRGQVIAKSGQTGSVSTPQLHFEIRKGSTPVDPMPFLDKGGSS
jgi:murein DD-endopeptidase MepM/ murein hydrolase activator NlpD